MKHKYTLPVLLLPALLMLAAVSARAQYKVLHSFNEDSRSNGAKPYGSLINIGNTLYGMTSEGGDNDGGIIFKTNTAGTSFNIIVNFNGDNGADPLGSLLNINDTLYGMTHDGGANAVGVIFKTDTIGNDFSYNILRNFNRTSGAPDGVNPQGSLINVNNILYGMTNQGGAKYDGNIFEINTAGADFKDIYDFGSNDTDALLPTFGDLTAITSTYQQGPFKLTNIHLYGMTELGGANHDGAIFSYYLPAVNTGLGSPYSILHSFNGSDGWLPNGSLLRIGNTFYGMTYQGGSDNDGVIFKINTDGTGFSVLHNFNGNDGAFPNGSLININDTLYGMTISGSADDGADGDGVIFRINTDGTGYTVLHTFSGSDGANPYGSLLNINDTLYGMTQNGGDNDDGIVFALVLNGNTTPVTLTGFTAAAVNNTALLQWHTATEINNNHFDIERSATPDRGFAAIGTMAGNGTTSQPHSYRFADNAPIPNSINYYRLRQVDNDGKFAYSGVVSASFGAVNAVQVYPNPAHNYIHIRAATAGSISIYDAGGKPVKTQAMQPGDNAIDIRALPAGVYYGNTGGEKIKFINE